MNHQEAVTLCRLAKAACPQQAFDSYTPDMWAEILADIRFVDAREAVVRIVTRSPWCSPSDIIAAVREMRAKRIDEFGPITPPADLDPDDTTAYREWWKDVQRQIADGDLKPKELDKPDPAGQEAVLQLTQGAFQRIPRGRQYAGQETSK